MIITLSGVTGTGKSYFKKKIQEEFKLYNQIIYTTRPIREKEINGVDKIFVIDKEFEKLKKEGKLIVTFEYLGYKYGYETSRIKSEESSVIELHYKTIYELKKATNKVFSIYIKPNKIDIAKNKLKERKIDKEQEKLRLEEIEEQTKEFEENKDIQEQFNYIFENNYDEFSTKKIIEVIKNKLNIC